MLVVMKKLIVIILSISVVAGGVLFWQTTVRDYLGMGSSALSLGDTVVLNRQEESTDSESSTSAIESGEQTAAVVVDTTPARELNVTVESVVSGLEVPWDFVFLSDSELLITERPGRVRLVRDGQLQDEPVFTVDNISSQSEEGLMGMVLDPQFSENSLLYACWAEQAPGGVSDRVVQLRWDGERLTEVADLLTGIPAARFHAGCRLGIGPDDKLYITTGDSTTKEIAQDIDSLGGKILRLNLDGSVPADNPFPDSPVYSYGHRNPQGIDWHPVYDYLIETEHGPSVNDGPAGGDEVNWIQAGNNYGWPVVSHLRSAAGMIDPLLVFTPAEAPASGTFYAGDVIPEFTHNYFFGALRGQGIIRIIFAADETPTVIQYGKLPQVDVGRVRAVKQGPDGALYFTSSNRDGRGQVRSGDDHLYRLVPAQQ